MAKIFTITEGLENMGALRSGGQGSVYKGRRIGPIITAIKLLPTPIHSESEDDKNYRNFKNEVEKLKRVNLEPNPNIVKILNYGITESGSLPFIEMEYIEGPDLEELLKPPHEKIYLIKEAIKVADQLACALLHCHKAGVRHGDIKSNNVKFNTNTGNYVLLDFGLAVMSDEQRRSSLRNAGAIEFMAPEQNEGVMLFQTDVYSYGIILYELLAGEVPFPLTDNSETARNNVRLAHMETPVPDLLEKRRSNLPERWAEEKQAREMQVPDWLLNLVYKCLQKKPEDRYADGSELHDALAYHQTSVGNTTLIAENQRLQNMLSGYQHNEKQESLSPDDAYYSEMRNSSLVHMSKPVFTGLVVMLIGFMAFSTYVLFDKRPSFQSPVTAIKPQDSIIKTDTSGLPANSMNLPAEKPNRKDTTIHRDSQKQEVSPFYHRRDSSKTEQDTLNQQPSA